MVYDHHPIWCCFEQPPGFFLGTFEVGSCFKASAQPLFCNQTAFSLLLSLPLSGGFAGDAAAIRFTDHNNGTGGEYKDDRSNDICCVLDTEGMDGRYPIIINDKHSKHACGYGFPQAAIPSTENYGRIKSDVRMVFTKVWV